jgi:prepilin-type N-terminal cleavage/methylation domain-containing protein
MEMFAYSEDRQQFWREPGDIPQGMLRRECYVDSRKVHQSLGFSPKKCAGFSLLELMVSLGVLLVISSATLSVISYYQQSYGRTEVQSDMYENVRGVAELMEQEVGQAGLVSLPSSAPTLSAAVVASTLAQNVNVSSATSMFVNEQVLVDAGTNEELVNLTAISGNQITAIFAKPHANGASINALGVFPNGIVPPGATDGSTSVAEPGVSVLNLFGDVNADGSLVYVRYRCDTSTTPGTLTRSVTTITPGVNTINTAQTLLSTLIPNPNNTACFQYTTTSVVVAGTTYTFVTNVGVTLSVQTLTRDPQTQQYLTMTKSFLDLSPRNVLAGFELANAGDASRLQAAPANVAAY